MLIVEHAAAAPRLCKISEARAQLNVSETTLYDLVAAGRLELRKINTASRIPQTSIDALIASLPRATLRRKTPPKQNREAA